MHSKQMEQECPLCSEPAVCHLVDYDHAKAFSCPKCGQYQISLRAERVLEQAPQQWRDQYASKARSAPEGKALKIQVPTPSQEQGSASAALTGTYVLFEKLPT